MDRFVHGPGKVVVRHIFRGSLMPHLMQGAAFVNHVGRVCDRRRGNCPYSEEFDLLRLPPGQRREIAASRKRVGVRGVFRGKFDPFVRSGYRRGHETEVWGPPLRDSYVAGKLPKYWEVC